jgi:hypothetical protein
LRRGSVGGSEAELCSVGFIYDFFGGWSLGECGRTSLLVDCFILECLDCGWCQDSLTLDGYVVFKNDCDGLITGHVRIWRRNRG